MLDVFLFPHPVCIALLWKEPWYFKALCHPDLCKSPKKHSTSSALLIMWRSTRTYSGRWATRHPPQPSHQVRSAHDLNFLQASTQSVPCHESLGLLLGIQTPHECVTSSEVLLAHRAAFTAAAQGMERSLYWELGPPDRHWSSLPFMRRPWQGDYHSI